MRSNLEQSNIERDLKAFNMSQPAGAKLVAFNKKKHREKQRAKIARCGSLKELARKTGKKL